MLDKRTLVLLGKVLIFGVGPLCLLGSLLIISQSGAVVSTGETIFSYLVFMAGLGAFAGGAYLWVRNR